MMMTVPLLRSEHRAKCHLSVALAFLAEIIL